jgi:ATP-dependent exoDNAse (exonuclease V) beta subunit
LVDQHERDLGGSDLVHGYCIEAAAGTGKTTLLIERLLAIVRSGRAELKDVVAITFTEKAADEIKVRLRERLEEARRLGFGGPKSPEGEGTVLARALEQLDRASISTIHAFAAALLRERPLEAGVDPGFEQLDEMGSQLLFDEVWRRWKEEQLGAPPPILRRLLALEVNPESVKSLAGKLLENRDVAATWAPGATEGEPPSAAPVNLLWTRVAALVQKLQALKPFCIDTSDRGYRQIERLSNLLDRTPPDELDRERALLLDLKVEGNCGAQNKWSPRSVCLDQKRICQELKALAEQEAPGLLGPSLTTGLLAWLGGFLAAVEGEKRARGVLDFQDLLLKARDLLRDRPEVRRYFQQRIRFLLVDEFQDTDPLQAELVFFLAEQGAVAADWRQVKLAPGKLFLVGDPKQSIYRFRRADIQVYEQAKCILSSVHPPLTIRQNFRSSPRLLQTINQVFAPQMTGEYQAGYVPLEPGLEHSEAGPAVAMLFPPATYVAGGTTEYFRQEADLLARFLRHIVQADGPVRIWDSAVGAPRPPRFGDIAVLFPVTTGLAYYEDALRACSVPCQLNAGRQFYTRRETRDLLSVLRACDDPENAIAVVAALRSPFFGLSDEDLFLYRHAGGRFHYGRPPREDFPRVAQSLRQLQRWHELRARTPLSALLDSILDGTCILPFLLLLPEGEQAVANLLRVVELARRFESQPGACLRAFVSWLERRVEAEVAEADAALDDEEDAVHLLTIHTAKGLEFPVVALASMACNRRNSENLLVDHAHGAIGVSLKCGEHRLSTANFEALALAEQQRARAEDLRLLYVAATRAKDCLVAPQVRPEEARQPRFLDFLDRSPLRAATVPPQSTCEDGFLLVRAEDLPQPEAPAAVLRHDVGARAAPAELVAPILEERQAWLQQRSELGLYPLERSAGVSPAGPVSAPIDPDAEPGSATRSRAFPPEAGAPSSRSPEGGARVGAWPGPESATARALGTAFHSIMQQVSLAGEPQLDVLMKNVVRAWPVERAPLGATVREWVQVALASPLWQRARRAARVWRELPFCVEAGGAVTEGYIDLLFEEDQGLVLVDYKTDNVGAKEVDAAVAAHRSQLEAYRQAIRRVVGREPRETWLYLVRPGVARQVSF